MIELLVCLPIGAALIALAIPSNRWRPCVLPLAALLHLVLSFQAILAPTMYGTSNWLVLDPLGKIFLGLIRVLFFLCAGYAVGYLAVRKERDNRVLCTCLLLSLGMMSLIILSHHLGLMWVAMEATTLLSAPGLYFNHNARSLEATWKFLLICSVGIALALMGSLFLAYAGLHEGLEPTLMLDDLVKQAPKLSVPWLHTAFVFLLVGYGTKMGLAPMHTWKPDAYGESPGMIGALLAGGMTNCAFLAILRFVQISAAAGDEFYARRLLIILGLLSMGLAAAFLVRQRDFKRMLAYSSVEHMGILALGVGVGGSATWAALLHVINNGLTKGILFLSAGNIHRVYGSKLTADVQGAWHRLPLSGSMFLIGFIAITGAPPFAPCVSELSLLNATFREGYGWIGCLFAFFMLVIFFGFGATVVSMVFGKSSASPKQTHFNDTFGTCWPIVVLAIIVLILGVYHPAQLTDLLNEAVAFLEMKKPI